MSKKIQLQLEVEDDVNPESVAEDIKEYIHGVRKVETMQSSGLLGLYRAKGSTDSE